MMMQKIDTDALKTKIFKLAFTGKLTNRDVNDEPVVDLEKTIIEENKKLIKERKLKKDSINSSIYLDDENRYCEKNDKNESHNIDKEIEFIIPKSWSFVRLKQVCYLNCGKEETGKELPYLDVKTLRNQKEADFAKEGIIVQQSQKLILVDGENSGEILNVPYEGYMGSTFRILETNSNIDKDYLIYFIMFHKNTLKSQKRGTAIPHLDKKIFYNLILPLPPREEQQRIVNMINIFLFEIQKIEMAELELQELEKKAKRKILDLAVCGKLVSQSVNDEPASVLLDKIKQKKEKLIKEGKIRKDKRDSTIYKGEDGHYYEKIGNRTNDTTEEIPFEIPDSWCVARLGKICKMETGNSINEDEKKKKYTNLPDGYNYIGTKDVNFDQTINYKNGVKIPYNTDFRIAHKDSTILCIEGGSAGRKIAILREDVCYGNKLCAFESYGIDKKFLFYYLQSPLFTKVFKTNINGIIGGVSIDKLKSLIILIPPLDEQRRIVDKLNQIFEII